MTIQNFSDSETARKSYSKDIDQALDSILPGANMTQESSYRTSRAEPPALTPTNADTSTIHDSYTGSQTDYNTVTDDQEDHYG